MDLGGSDWWTQALAQSNVINTEDYDSLIDNITETSKDRVTVVDKVRNMTLSNVNKPLKANSTAITSFHNID